MGQRARLRCVRQRWALLQRCHRPVPCEASRCHGCGTTGRLEAAAAMPTPSCLLASSSSGNCLTASMRIFSLFSPMSARENVPQWRNTRPIKHLKYIAPVGVRWMPHPGSCGWHSEANPTDSPCGICITCVGTRGWQLRFDGQNPWGSGSMVAFITVHRGGLTDSRLIAKQSQGLSHKVAA